MRLDQKTYFTSENNLENGRFHIYVMSDVQNVLTSLVFAGILVAVALLLMTAWVLFQSKQVTERKTEDLYKLLDGMELARQGNLERTGAIDRDNEFKMIAEAYNETITSLKEQMENNQKMTELLALAQTKQLESQFNPHFSIIHWKISGICANWNLQLQNAWYFHYPSFCVTAWMAAGSRLLWKRTWDI